jgi:hypothetical protein
MDQATKRGLKIGTALALTPFVLLSLPSWWFGMCAAMGMLALEYERRLSRIRGRKDIHLLVSFYIKENEIAWRLKQFSKYKYFDPDLIWPSVSGCLVALAIGSFLLRNSHSLLFIGAFLVSTLSIPLLLILIGFRGPYQKKVYSCVKYTLRIEDPALPALVKLREYDAAISKIKQERGISSPTNYIGWFEGYLERNAEWIVKDWTQVEMVANAKVIDAYKELMALTTEVTEKKESKENQNGETKEERPKDPPRPSRMTKEEALKILGLSVGATFADVQTARKEAIKKFNVDHRQELEPHIRELVEEKFKQVNMAYDYLKAAF